MVLHADDPGIGEAVQHLKRGDLIAAEGRLAPILLAHTGHAQALLLMGVLRYRQRRMDEAADFLSRSLAAKPDEPVAQFNLGQANRARGMADAAIAAFRGALDLKPDYWDAFIALGDVLEADGQIEAAENTYRQILSQAPGRSDAALALGKLLTASQRPGEAEAVLRDTMAARPEPQSVVTLERQLALALRAQGRWPEALGYYEHIRSIKADAPRLDIDQAALLDDMGRHEEALALLYDLLERQPKNLHAHRDYNHLLYRLEKDGEFLSSYDRALRHDPENVPLRLEKAWFLLNAQRYDEAHADYVRVLAHDASHVVAANGAAVALEKTRHFEAALAAYEAALLRHPEDSGLYGNIASVLLKLREPEKARHRLEQGLARNPYDQTCLAALGIAYRMTGDAREIDLDRYTDFIRIYELDPPDGYSDMAAFNRDLNHYLDRLHPPTRAYINQSLRGGTQTPNNIFGAGHVLVEKLAMRIWGAVDDYISHLRSIAGDRTHPYLSRLTEEFVFSGSWSSRLNDCGFHENHIHPYGWISSCYYVATPDESRNRDDPQGWIKFGEPSHDFGLPDPVRRIEQPMPGHLVLFPSYMWHGTIPFRSRQSRTTIAFDAVPR